MQQTPELYFCRFCGKKFETAKIHSYFWPNSTNERGPPGQFEPATATQTAEPAGVQTSPELRDTCTGGATRAGDARHFRTRRRLLRHGAMRARRFAQRHPFRRDNNTTIQLQSTQSTNQEEGEARADQRGDGVDGEERLDAEGEADEDELARVVEDGGLVDDEELLEEIDEVGVVGDREEAVRDAEDKEEDLAADHLDLLVLRLELADELDKEVVVDEREDVPGFLVVATL